MQQRLPLIILISLVAAGCSGQPQETTQAKSTQPERPAPKQSWTTQRVQGNPAIQPRLQGGQWRFGDMLVEENLPVGYPAPTPPGVIEIKQYPAVRRAQVTAAGNYPDAGMWMGFWPLFQHIERNEIPMTSPVEMDMAAWDGSLEDPPSQWTMSFLYRTADMGPVGQDGIVEIVDREPVTVLSMGLKGPYGMQTVSPGIQQLQDWIDAQDEWERAGDPRAFYYNGPYIPNRLKWAEAQIPVQKRTLP